MHITDIPQLLPVFDRSTLQGDPVDLCVSCESVRNAADAVEERGLAGAVDSHEYIEVSALHGK